MLHFVFVLIMPWLLALLLTPGGFRAAHRTGWLDMPGDRKHHPEPVALLGGVVIFASSALGLALAMILSPPIREILIASEHMYPFAVMVSGGLAMLVMGAIDDRQDLRAVTKLLIQLAIAAFTWYGGFRIGVVELPFGWFTVDGVIPSFLMTVGWIVLITNAFNLIDGMDGLSTGTGIIVVLTLFILGTAHRESVAVIASLSLAGSMAGLLRFNVPPARIYLGDGGAYLIGYSSAVLGIACTQKSSAAMVVAVPLLALGLPLLDTVFAVVRRAIAYLRHTQVRELGVRGVVNALFKPDRGHIHHLLLRSGWSTRQALYSIYLVSLVLASVALWTQGLSSNIRWLIVIATVGAGFVAIRVFEGRLDARDRELTDTSADEHAASSTRRAAG